MTGHIAYRRQKTNAHKGLVTAPDRMRPLQRFWQRWKDKAKMDLKETGQEGGQINFVQNRDTRQAFVKMIMSLWYP